jgi:hypothetical protein
MVWVCLSKQFRIASGVPILEKNFVKVFTWKKAIYKKRAGKVQLVDCGLQFFTQLMKISFEFTG